MTSVLFVCLHGSAKSMIAAEHFRRLAEQQGSEIPAESAGLEPDAEIPPRVIQGLLGDGIDARERRPRGVTPADVERASHVVTFGCDLGALESFARHRVRWEDVHGVSDGYKPARDVIVARVSALLAELSHSR